MTSKSFSRRRLATSFITIIAGYWVAFDLFELAAHGVTPSMYFIGAVAACLLSMTSEAKGEHNEYLKAVGKKVSVHHHLKSKNNRRR